MSDQMFNDWLLRTRILQTDSYGVDPWKLSTDEQVDFINWNYTATVKELGELLDEMSWKTWTVGPNWVNRDGIVGEAVDALHFIANILVAVQCTDEELTDKYVAKMDKNRRRMASGEYDGVKDKCPVCKRALDDDAVTCGWQGTAWTCFKDGR